MSASRFAKLVDLAQASDSERRRELLREVTDLFFETTGGRNDRENALFDEVLRLVAGQMQDGVLAELAEVFADATDAPVGLMKDLASHSFEIARDSSHCAHAGRRAGHDAQRVREPAMRGDVDGDPRIGRRDRNAVRANRTPPSITTYSNPGSRPVTRCV